MYKRILKMIAEFVTNNPLVVRVVMGSPWLHQFVNKLMINTLVNSARARPHPWSTQHSYTSWDALSDKSWSARHLPAAGQCVYKSSEAELSELFQMQGEQKLCDKSTCLFPAFAQHLTDGFIRTVMPRSDGGDDRVRLRNTSNHEIDLSPLYGRCKCHTDALRLKSETCGEKGRLKSQFLWVERSEKDEEFARFLFDGDGEFSEKEFEDLDPPLSLSSVSGDSAKLQSLFAFGGDRANAAPQVAMINTLLLREHNRIAAELERGNADWDDERVFQTARNALIAIYIKVVIEEYINHISPTRLPFIADPAVAWTAKWNRPNWITTEFSLLYRWHSLVPTKVRWGGREYLTEQTILNNQPLLQNGLKNSLLDVSSQPAARLGVLNTVPALLSLESSAIRQGRLIELKSYNSYREYLSLPKVECFEEISSNSKVVAALNKHYDSVDDVEFYTGLFAEDQQPNSPLPQMLLLLVGVDAFSQALTNPLFSRSVFSQGAAVFGEAGLRAFEQTSSLLDIVQRNCGRVESADFIGMTRPDWELRV